MPNPYLTEEVERFPERLKLAIGKISARAFALQCGMSSTVMHQYLTGKSEPTRLALIAIAHTAGVYLEWLITGEGPREKSMDTGKCRRDMIDRSLYDGIMKAVEKWLNANGKTLTTRRKLDVYRYFYDFSRIKAMVDDEQVGKMLSILFS